MSAEGFLFFFCKSRAFWASLLSLFILGGFLPPTSADASSSLEPPPPMVEIHVWARGTPFNGQALQDKCGGPIVLYYKNSSPVITQHDYCGGHEALGLLEPGSLRLVSGTTAEDGIYRVVRLKVVKKGVSWDVFKGAAIIFQTCIPGTKLMILSFAERIL
jgi:hypothetical protein